MGAPLRSNSLRKDYICEHCSLNFQVALQPLKASVTHSSVLELTKSGPKLAAQKDPSVHQSQCIFATLPTASRPSGNQREAGSSLGWDEVATGGEELRATTRIPRKTHPGLMACAFRSFHCPCQASNTLRMRSYSREPGRGGQENPQMLE